MTKTERLLIRVSVPDKTRLRMAAQADGRSVSSFVVRAALAAVDPMGYTLHPLQKPIRTKTASREVAQ